MRAAKARCCSDRQVIEQPRLVREERQLLFRRDRVLRQVVAADANAAARGRNDAGQAAQRGGLARAVGPDQAHDFAGLHVKASSFTATNSPYSLVRAST